MPDARLCLNMIVRNEAPIILRALESVADHIACWVVSDTGSGDDTKAVIASFFAARGVPGSFADSPFDTFDAARNRALDAARTSGASFDYILLMDADMELRVDDPGFRRNLQAPAYRVLQQSGISYWNTRLVRRDVDARYRGVTHEYLDIEGEPQPLNDVWFVDRADGGNRPDKFARDIALLSAGLEAEPDNARYVYYLAQSYRDDGQHENAAATYARRFAMGGWEEERWSALLNEARCRLAGGDETGFIATANRAFAFRPSRAEPLFELAQYHRTRGHYEDAMAVSEQGASIAWPAADRLFIEDFAYRFGFRQEVSISGFYSQSPQRQAAGRRACNGLAVDRDAPLEVRLKARENLVYYASPANRLLPSWSAQRLAWLPPAGNVINPSIARVEGHNLLIARVVNYTTTDGARYDVVDGKPISTRNYLLRLDDDLRPFAQAEILPPADFPEPRFPLVRGFEDMRLFSWRGDLWCSSTVRELTDEGWCEVVLARIAPSPAGEAQLLDWRVLTPAGSRRHEKNWMPSIAGELRFIYGSDPVRLLDSDAALVTEAVTGIAADHLRGGSQVVDFNSGFLAVTHETVTIERRRYYLHRFAWYDEDMTLRRLTEPFFLNAKGLEFVAGLAWHGDGRRLIVSYGVGDAEAWLATLDATDVGAALLPVEEFTPRR